MSRLNTTAVLSLTIFALLLAGAGPATAGMVLTPGAAADGFTLTTFADGFSHRSDGLGPIGIGFSNTGGVLVSVNGGSSSFVYAFPTDTDGQTAGSVTPVNYGGGWNSVAGIARVGSQLYMAESNLGQIIQLNNNGTAGSVVATGFGNPVALATDTSNGHLFVSVYQGDIYDLNPQTGLSTAFSTQNVDGLTYDSATNTLYGAREGNGYDILGFNVATGQQVFDSGVIAGDPDGAAVGYGSLAGKLFVNTNGGTVVEINLATKVQTVIASGGSRGDLISVDPSNNSLLLTQSDSVLRLTAPDDSGFGNPTSAVPAPSSLLLMGIGLAVLAAFAIHKRRKPALT